MKQSYKRSILVINPNTTKQMTDALVPIIASLELNNTRFEYFTAPSGVPSINDEDDAAVSAEHCLPALKPKLGEFDAFLVCCYSQHPLVHLIRRELATTGPDNTHQSVTGIFEASVATCLQAINIDDKFGIVSTGKQWEDILDEAVQNLFGAVGAKRYAGTETTGFNAVELHKAPPEEVSRRMKAATKRLLGKGAAAICLGCAGMAGMDRTVRQACIEELGEDKGKRIKIVDGVISGAIFLDGVLRTPQ